MSDATLAAVTTFCTSIDATSGLRAAILRCNLFCGNSDASLNAVRTPLYLSGSLGGSALGNTIDTNFNFAQGDYQETGSSGGLKGNGTNKFLNTGFATTLLSSQTSAHLSVSGTSMDAIGGGNTSFIGTDVGTASQVFTLDENLDYVGDVRAFRHGSGFPSTTFASTTIAASESHLIGTRNSTTDSRLYRAGVMVATPSASVSPASSTQSIFVFAIGQNNNAVSHTPARFRMYSIGNGLTAAQALAFSNAVIAFNTALGRA